MFLYGFLCEYCSMPAREPTFYRWAEHRPCTTNQTYGYELRSQLSGYGRSVGTGSNRTCKLCAAAARRQAERLQHRQMTAATAAGSRRDGVGGVKHSDKVQCKPINKGYTMGHVPITKRLQQASSAGGSRQRNSSGASSTSSSSPLGEQHQQPDGKDLYLWHALSGTLVCCRNDEEFDD